MSFLEAYEVRKENFSESLNRALRDLHFPRSESASKLRESLEYSLLGNGKRFRPVLGLLLSEAFGAGPAPVTPWLIAIEMVHTYSLVHDDLPCLDNDDYRRGQPTNHKIFGEDIALLAGDALLTEAFRYLAEQFQKQPEKGIELIRILGEAAGTQGMVTGQIMDVIKSGSPRSLQELNLMHSLKTGALIRATTEGVAVALGVSAEKRELCRKFGSLVGLSFQLKDDLLDSKEKIEKGSFPEALGLAEVEKYLSETTEEAKNILKSMQVPVASGLFQILDYNRERLQ